MSDAAATFLAVAEILLLAMAGFAAYRRRGATLAEAISFGVLLPWMSLSLIYQLALIVRTPPLATAGEVVLTVVAMGVLFRRRTDLSRDSKAIGRFVAGRPASAGIFLLLLFFLATLAFLQPPPAAERENFPRAAARPVSPATGSALETLCSDPPAGPMVWNSAIIALRFPMRGSASGSNLPGFFAYLAVVFGTYALARRYAWPPTAFAVAVMVASMPRLVLLSMSPGLELVPAAATLFALLSLYRAVESPSAVDLGAFLVAASFGISQVWMSRVAVLLLLPLAAVIILRRHGTAVWFRTVRRRWLLISAALAVALVFSQLWWILSQGSAESVDSLRGAVTYNADGIQGAGANMLRYLIQSLHIPPPLNALCRWAFSFEPSRLIEAVFVRLIAPLLGDTGAAAAFHLDPSLRLPTVWFGPFAGLVVLPAVVFCVRRAPRRLKAVAVMLSGYFFLASLIPAWSPQSARQFTVFYACGGFCAAYFLPPWRFGPRTRSLLVGFSLALLGYSCLAGAPDIFGKLLPWSVP